MVVGKGRLRKNNNSKENGLPAVMYGISWNIFIVILKKHVIQLHFQNSNFVQVQVTLFQLRENGLGSGCAFINFELKKIDQVDI